MKNLLTTIVLLLFLCITSQAQDLIERTQQNKVGKSANSTDNPNRLAELIAKNRKQAKKMTVVNVFTFNQNKSAKIKEYVDKSVRLTLEKTIINQLLNEKPAWLSLQVPVNETNYFELELVRQNIQTPNYKVTVSSPLSQPYQSANMIFYKGIIKNDNQSLAAVTISNNKIRILASDKDGNYVVGKLPESNEKYVLYNDVHLKQTQQFTCGTSEIPQEGSVEANTAGTTIVNGQCVPVYIEADYAFYQDNNSSASDVEVYLNGLFNEVETIYFNESTGLSISEIFVHTSPGPYINTSSTDQALELFRDLRQNNFNGRLAHLVSGRSLGGGIAYVDVLCSVNLNHAVSALNSSFNTFPSYSWDLYVFSHEMGHNFGSWHTHSCVWNGNNTAIDGCAGFTDRGNCSLPATPSNGGTIMSYCHLQNVGVNFSRGFGSQPGNLLRNRFNNSSCILECEESCNYAGNPCNFIPNPDFDNGVDSWYWWNCDASAPSGICKIENIIAGGERWDANVISEFLCLAQGVNYQLSFDAYSETSRDFWVKVGLGEDPWTSYLYQQVNTTGNFENFTHEFAYTLPSTSIGRLEFHVGGSGNLADIYIDNIVLQPSECSSDDVCEKIENGTFANGFEFWDYWGMSQPDIISGACYLSNFNPVVGDPVSWNAALNYPIIPFDQNQSYTIQFSARSVDAPRTFIIKAGLGEAPWTAYLWETVNLTTQMETFSYSFTMPNPSISNGTLEFQVGDSNIPLYIDEVTLIENDCQSAGLSNTCIENVSLDGIPDNHIYQAGFNIFSTAKIQSNTNVLYSAGESILLQTGFELNNGAVFKANIQGCE